MSKLSKREELLLSILIWTIVVVSTVVYFYFQIEKIKTNKKNIDLLEKQIEQLSVNLGDEEKLLSQKEALLQKVQEEREKFYSPEEMDPYRFGTLVRNLLASKSLSVKRYQTIEVGEVTYLEFSISGNALHLAEFLKSVSSNNKYWSIPFLSIDARRGDGSINAVFRITYETVNKQNS